MSDLIHKIIKLNKSVRKEVMFTADARTYENSSWNLLIDITKNIDINFSELITIIGLAKHVSVKV